MSESIPADRSYDLYSQSMKKDPYPVFDRMRQMIRSSLNQVLTVRP